MEEHNKELYGADAAEWVRRWDNGQSIWSIEMGGLGPGYEQAIQISAVEMVRWFLNDKTDAALFSDEKKYPALRDRMDATLFAEDGPLKDMGLSGAQVGAARNIACHIYRDGPVAVMANEQVKDRHIQVSRDFPKVAA